ncbi:AAA ATPase domain-containing protein [Tieghemostelium lacteum]|uniref:AAA ATPase domain-containing protein n=1 Tax=Tieghemostelium lacteum TaxID=361077 RepID=A0A151Z878_TIELA|nr:AAA ATPase domain-containing protein [Tieghemostelium lacteum]|eukprot:KYQ90160.1 AAA ATPase domain-containing protein [Tieghemostelium lacteum]
MSHDWISYLKIFRKNVLPIIVAAGSLYVINKLVHKMIDGNSNEKESTVMKKIKTHPNREKILKETFNRYEIEILEQLVVPSEGNIGFEDIGGLTEIIEDLKDTIFLPLSVESSELFSVPKGILLFGPPGTGKTMLAKAISSHYSYNFININNSIIDNKFYGETEKYVNAIFSVAKKLQPTIIFFDEIDSMTAKRGQILEVEAATSKKAILLQLWDGFNNSKDKIIIIGATNRPEAIDDAFIRRLPKKIKVGLPTRQERVAILKIILKDATEEGFDFYKVADETVNLTGSDLKEISKSASKNALKRSTAQPRLKNSDFIKPIAEFKESLKHINFTYVK